MNGLKKILRTFLGIPITLISFIFIGKLFFDNRQTIINSFAHLDYLVFLLGVLFFFLFFFIKSLIWIQILKRRGYAPNVRRTLFDYGISEAKRYIPGSVFAFAGRVHTHSKTLPGKETLKGIGIEIALQVISAFVVSIPAMLIVFKKTTDLNGHLAIFLTVLSLTFLSVTFVLVKKNLKSLSVYADLGLLYVACWVLFGLANFFILYSLAQIPLFNFTTIISAFVLSWLVGYLFFITPMGLGVRELSLVFLLSLFTPFAIATSVAILTRISMTVGEIFYLFFVYVLRNLSKIPKIISSEYTRFIVFLFSVSYTLLFSYLSIIKHANFYSGRFDLGNMSQTVWNTAHGNFFMLTNPDGVTQISRLGVHSDFILVLFAPLYLLFPSPNVLLIFQSAVIGMGGFFLYLIARELLKNPKIAAVFSVSYFLNFWIHYQNLFDFHAVSLATGFLMASFYFLLKNKMLPFFIFTILAMLTKENVFLVTFLLGLYIFKKKKKTTGSAIAVVSLLFFAFLALFAIPNARGTEHFALSYYSYLGNSALDILKNFFIKPEIITGQLFSVEILNYFHMLLAPTGYLSLLSPLYMVFSLPDITIYLLSSNQNLRQQYYHYGALIIPFIYISSIYSVKKLISKFKKLPATSFIFYYLLATSVISCYFYSPLPGMKNASYNIFKNDDSEKIKKYLDIIPPNASVSSSNSVGAHLSHRSWIFVVPHGMDRADYIVLYNENSKLQGEVDQLFYEELVKDKLINFVMYKKKSFTFCNSCNP